MAVIIWAWSKYLEAAQSIGWRESIAEIGTISVRWSPGILRGGVFCFVKFSVSVDG
jgi:hypothetical protein